MKRLSMRKIDLGAGYFRYEVIEADKVIAKRVSYREYIAAFIVKQNYRTDTGYVISKMFGRKELLERAKSGNIYAIAELTQ